MTAKTLMIVGTSSSAGKSLLVTALCHSYARRGIKVAPFKAQNMSNNAAVCPDGSEIGRAQAVQAAAAGLEPTVDMNPILIKPEADSTSQIVVNGKPWKTLHARDYYPKKDYLWKQVTSAIDRLRAEYELVLIEGAGSPAELNLKEGDIVNMATALYAEAPTLLVGDVDRGGIFAQLLGTYWLLPPEEQEILKGFIVNKFRGDITLFEDGIQIIEERSGVPVFGVVPYLHDLYIPEEDAVSLEAPDPIQPVRAASVDIAVIHLPRIANFDDFDPLLAEPGVRLRYVDSPTRLGKPNAIIIPGTKSTIGDLHWLRSRGLATEIQKHVQNGGSLVGICGGYQILGTEILDPHNVESREAQTAGLGFLPISTTFVGEKATYRAKAKIRFEESHQFNWLCAIAGKEISGYEIHKGRTTGADPWLKIIERNQKETHDLDGAISTDGRIWGCYIHGLFGNQNLRRAWLRSLGWTPPKDAPMQDDPFAASLTYLTDTVESALDMQLLEKIIWES
ncbi:MAG: cobyric acid synthase [Anaerolineales bacterium]|nr:cobyric acid synthase [Chloroflexota bacterium]MBL6982921.1 cobyric acid synthase [Anaerolineales bacterium]